MNMRDTNKKMMISGVTTTFNFMKNQEQKALKFDFIAGVTSYLKEYYTSIVWFGNLLS